MMRKIGIGLLCAGGLFSTQAFTMTDHVFTQGLAVEYELPPHAPQSFANIFFWTIKAVCTVVSEVPNNTISIKMLHKTGEVNGIPLTVGDTTLFSAHSGDKLYITANSGAKVELLNLGDVSIKASCAAAT